MIGWLVVRLCLVACFPGELSQHPTCPHSWHTRKWTQLCFPMATHSTQPAPEGATSLMWSRCVHVPLISRLLLVAGARTVRGTHFRSQEPLTGPASNPPCPADSSATLSQPLPPSSSLQAGFAEF